MQDRMRLVQVERERVRTRLRVGPRPLGDAQQKDDLVADLGRRGIENAHDLELRQRRAHVVRREDRVLFESPPEIHTVAGFSASSWMPVPRASSTSRIMASTRRPIAGQAISLPYS